MAIRITLLRTPAWVTGAVRWERTALAVAAAVLLRLLLVHGYRLLLPGPLERALRLAEPVLLLLFAAAAASRLAEDLRSLGRRGLRGAAVDLAIGALALALLPRLYPTLTLVLLRLAALQGRRLASSAWARAGVAALQTSPERLVLLSFAGLILAGTYLLSLPAAVSGAASASWHEALFTATSAVCVTGLIVVDTGSYFSLFGQGVILGLIQAGGLGIMTLSTAAALLLGQTIGLRQRRALQAILEEESAAVLRRSIRFIVLMTLSVEALGFAVLWGYWWARGGDPAGSAYTALFHAVSAFCNAGFSLFRDNLAPWRGSVWINLWISLLIVVGGLGFTVVGELAGAGVRSRLRARRAPSLSLHSVLVLRVTGLLLAVGTLGIFFLEFDHVLAGLPLGERLLAAGFQSVTLRTAGFNTIDIGALQPVTLLLMLVWMWIGGSPGSTAGGIKTSTAAVLWLMFRALVRGRSEVEVSGRTLDPLTLHRAVAVSLVSGIIVAVFVAGLLLAEPHLGFDRLLFEAVSAFGTVGLSTGITPQLGPPARLLVVALMFAGRVGPLTLALAAGRRPRPLPVRFPQGRVIVG
jgi:trk system potassium uptake protein TrkH